MLRALLRHTLSGVPRKLIVCHFKHSREVILKEVEVETFLIELGRYLKHQLAKLNVSVPRLPIECHFGDSAYFPELSK
jgi:hypothetical protein